MQYSRLGLCPGSVQSPWDGLQPFLASVHACPGTTGVADRTESLALCCIPEGNCGHKLLGVGKYLSGFQKPGCGLVLQKHLDRIYVWLDHQGRTLV